MNVSQIYDDDGEASRNENRIGGARRLRRPYFKRL
jgi:hypothetical protein